MIRRCSNLPVPQHLVPSHNCMIRRCSNLPVPVPQHLVLSHSRPWLSCYGRLGFTRCTCSFKAGNGIRRQTATVYLRLGFWKTRESLAD
eukprot:symbB.v1.2.004743.t1/scaffold275.1/size244369/13